MLLMTQLNLSPVSNSVNYLQLDSLTDIDQSSRGIGWPQYGTYDAIFTNPPFGVNLDGRNPNLSRFKCNLVGRNGTSGRVPSEVLFIEQCLNFLRPGGTLAIVVPKSVLTNRTLSVARKELGQLGYIYAAVSLPPETFAVTGTNATTYVLFIRKFEIGEDTSSPISVPLVEVQNVGFDNTGRSREGNQLSRVAGLLKEADQYTDQSQNHRIHLQLSKEETFVNFAVATTSRRKKMWHYKLDDYVEFATTGRTPARSDYSNQGLFLVKVGNLTGSGIRWVARERNFISGSAAEKIGQNPNLILRAGDILLTASAHSPIYIAKKVDVMVRVPDWIGGKASFVGETMMLRPRKGVDSYHLLAFLRQAPDHTRNTATYTRSNGTSSRKRPSFARSA